MLLQSELFLAPSLQPDPVSKYVFCVCNSLDKDWFEIFRFSFLLKFEKKKTYNNKIHNFSSQGSQKEGFNRKPIVKTEEEFVFVDKYNVKTETTEKMEEPERVVFNETEASNKQKVDIDTNCDESTFDDLANQSVGLPLQLTIMRTLSENVQNIYLLVLLVLFIAG